MLRQTRSAAVILALLAVTPASGQPVLLVSNVGGSNVLQFSDGNVATTYASGFNTPTGLAVDGAKNLFVADAAGSVYRVTTSGTVSFFAAIVNPLGLAFDSSGNLYAASGSGNSVSKIAPSGSVNVFASGFNTPGGRAFDGNGNLYVANYNRNSVSKVAPDGTVGTFASGFNGPIGLAVDASGNLYVANGLSNLIDRVSPSGSVSPFASLPGLNPRPEGLTFANDGNLYAVASANNEVFKVTPGGVVTNLVAGPFNDPEFIVPSPVPEPGTLILVGAAALAGLGLRARCARRT